MSNEERENELFDRIFELEAEIQESNDSVTWWINRFNAVERDNRKLKEENKRLKELCDKYEEEHKTTFEQLQEDINKHCVNQKLSDEVDRLNNIINNFEKWLEEQIKICQAHDNEFGVNVCNTFKDKLKELKGDSSNE